MHLLSRQRAFAPVLLAVVLLGVIGCDVVEKQDETRQYVGRYVTEASSDTLLISFTPHPNYDEEDESPYLPDTTIDLLEIGARLEFTLDADGRSANQGGVNGELTIPELLFLDPDSLYPLVLQTAAVYEGKYVSVVDRVFMREMTELQPSDTTDAGAIRTTLPLPREWFRTEDGGLRGTISGGQVLGLVYFFNTISGRRDSTITTIGNLALNARVSRQ